jgi:hypothetical protein
LIRDFIHAPTWLHPCFVCCGAFVGTVLPPKASHVVTSCPHKVCRTWNLADFTQVKIKKTLGHTNHENHFVNQFVEFIWPCQIAISQTSSLNSFNVRRMKILKLPPNHPISWRMWIHWIYLWAHLWRKRTPYKRGSLIKPLWTTKKRHVNEPFRVTTFVSFVLGEYWDVQKFVGCICLRAVGVMKGPNKRS